jgi:hypothetical protein
MRKILHIYICMYCVYASFYYFFIGQFNKHKPTMTIEEWDRNIMNI